MAKLYRHYKGMYYLLHQEVTHSETLEKLVYYECLYNNPTAKLWVRPKEMFFEEIEIKGQVRPRFEKVQINYRETESLSTTEKKQIANFFKTNQIFETFDEAKFLYQLDTKSRLYACLAFIDDELIAVKLGYVLSPSKFYSWIGGVAVTFRKAGIASELMKRQHDWCRKQKFLLIETRTRNQYPEMIALNLKFGFQIIGTRLDKKGEPKVLLEKNLSPLK